MDIKELEATLAAHKKWLKTGGQEGKQAYLLGAELQKANLLEANLQKADLRGADLQKADLLGANLRGANLHGADLREANLLGADLQGANLEVAYLRRANLQVADLQGADLQGTDLQGADLQGANLQKASLQGANLQGANLRAANLRGAILLGANLQGANLHGASYGLEQLKQARNVPEQAVTKPKTADALYNEQVEKAEIEINNLKQAKEKLEEKLSEQNNQNEAKQRELTERLQTVENDLSAEQQAKQQAEARQDRLADMEVAIDPILKSTGNNNEIINSYKTQSLWLLRSGILCFVLVIFYFIFLCFLIALKEAIEITLVYFSPAAILVLTGTGLLRHDWKIRQLILKLIEQNHQANIGTGLLKSSLGLSNLDKQQERSDAGVPKLVESTFSEVRHALLFREKFDGNQQANNGDDIKSMLQSLLDHVKKD